LRENAIWKDNANFSLILIGTVHGDPRGQARAGKLLQHLRPEMVTVEISPFSLRYRHQHEALWQRQLANALAELPEGAALHLAIRRLAAQVAMPFEVRAARDYSRSAGVPWHPLDLVFLSRRHLPRYATELLTPANLEALLAGYPKSDAAPEAIFLRGVSRYKSTHEAKPLKEAYELLQAQYPGSEWTKRAYPYRLL